MPTPPTSIEIYAEGLCHLSVCALASLARSEVESLVNNASPSGVNSPWTISKDENFLDGTTIPHQCEDDPSRQHWLLDC